MPNWCFHNLKLKGDKEDILAFKKLLTSKIDRYGEKRLNVLDTNNIIPYPKKFLDLDINPKTRVNRIIGRKCQSVEGKDGFNSGGYDWCLQNWGTKWGICQAYISNENLNDKKSEISYCFETAWSPGEQVILKMSELFPTLTFYWECEEESMEFRFKCKIKEGKVLKETNLLKD